MEESRRRRSCRRSRLFRRFGASRETEKNASRRDSRERRIARVAEIQVSAGVTARDGGSQRVAFRVSQSFFWQSREVVVCVFSHARDFWFGQKYKSPHPPRSRARSARNSPRSVNVRRFIRGFRRPARFRACAANRWLARVHARRPRARATLPARRARRAERTTGTEVSGKEERAGCARREARASRALDV